MSRFSQFYLGYFFLLISILSFFNIIYSYYFNLYLNIDTYIVTGLFSLFISFIFLINKKKFLQIKKIEKKTSIYEKIIIVILGYFIIPLVLSIPYNLSIYNISFLNSYFESISGFTSTGYTIFENIKHLDQSLIIWRSTTQWIGGLYFLFSIILLIDIFDNNLKKSFTDFLSFDSTEILKQSIKVLFLYSILTFLIFLLFKIINLRSFDAFNLSLTVISSGGFIPSNNLQTIINTDFKALVLSFTFLISFFSIFFSYNIFFFRRKNLNFFSEDFYLSIYLLILIVIFFIFFNDNNNFPSVLLAITSSISNIGIHYNNNFSNQYFVYLLLVIIGGSFFSTSSGIRFLKLFTLIKFSVNNLLSHSKPSQILVQKMTFGEKNIEHEDINKYFLSVIIFIISLFSIIFLLTISEINFADSFKLGILTLMNTVNSSIYGLENFEFMNINHLSKSILIIFMIIGRVELLTILILFKKFLFKN